ncbi:hypothetical protein BJY04DRAFT_213387 [Aspergillus karnatakaensis]|uniref:nonribosomal siderophore peptide synthase SidC n=1 Tax=Aspergillus karnatakaensis TaxID=1810916 RepID=UPI003CCCE2F4
MGKRKLAGSVRRYVSSGLSRVTKGITRVLNNEEKEEHPNGMPQNGLHAAEPMDVVPVTKVPALDTVDPYVVERPIEEEIVGWSQRITLSCTSGPNVIDHLIRGYARFIAAFTGLEDVAFYTLQRLPFVDSESWSLITASIDKGDHITVASRETDADHDQDVQFYAELGARVKPENGGHFSPRGDAFTMFVEPDNNGSALHISFAYPKRLIPHMAVYELLRTISSHITQAAPGISNLVPHPELSILNFPPSMIPPTAQSRGVENYTSESRLLHSAFEGWARRNPHSIALNFVHSLGSGESHAKHSILTYAALHTAASNLALNLRSFLSDHGEEFGRIIPVNMSTSPELYISYLGILKAGYAFCPVPQDAPAQRIQEILRDINSPIILGNTPEPSSETRKKDGTIYESTPVWVDVAEASKWKQLEGDSPLEQASHDSLNLPIQQDQTAYLLFTSGSTGKPKGVQVSHLAGSCSISSHATAIPLPGKKPGDFRWFQFASPSFDPSLMEIFVTLSSGGTLCSADRKLTLANLEDTINEVRATVMMATPSLASLLRPERLHTLEALWSMGEKLNRTVIDNFARSTSSNEDTGSSKPRMLVNAYGPTEGAINCTYVAPFERSMRGSIIGKPLPTSAMLILSPYSQEPKAVPVGTVGELAIAGPQVSKGYLNRPEETAKAFVDSAEFGRVYRTGDKARIVWDQDGSQVIEYLGRISTDQVKINGRRVELGEIESVVATVQGVTEVVVTILTRDGKPEGNEQIVACIVANGVDRPGKESIVRQARENAERHLIPSMCPSIYRFFDSLPRSSSGKVDRKTLSASVQEQTAETPENIIGTTQAGEWDSVGDEDMQSVQPLVIRLITETADEDSSFITPETGLYSLGIDSLGAMRLLQKLRDSRIDGLSVSDVLQSQTAQGLVSLIQEHRAKQNGHTNGEQNGFSTNNLKSSLAAFSDRTRTRCAEHLNVSLESIEDCLPTTATQSGMLNSFLRSVEDDSYAKRTYIYHSVLPIEPFVHLEKLKEAWNEVVSHYDSFRTVFCIVDDEMAPFAQCITTPESVPHEEWALYTNPNESTSEQDVIEEALRGAEQAISLDKPPWNLSLVNTSNRSFLVLSMFHGIFDGGSLQLLLQDVSSAYSGQALPQRTSLRHIVQHHFRADHATTSSFWKDYLHGYTLVKFPSVTPHRPPSQKSTNYVELKSSFTNATLKKISKSIGSTPLSVLQAAWGAVLLSYTGTPDQDVVMGSVVSGRLDQHSQECIGPTFTITPQRLSLQQLKAKSGCATNSSVARYLSSSNAKALAYLQPRLGSVVVAEGQLPYDTVLAYQDFGADPESSDIWSSVSHPAMANDFSVMIEIVPEPDLSLTLRATFDTKLDAAGAEIMLRQMDDIVKYILEQPDGSFEHALTQSRPELKSTANQDPVTAPEVSEGALLQSQFEEHAASHSDDLALIFKADLDNSDNPGNVSWTYAQLNAMADDLAEHLLQIRGDLTDASVPICIEKSPALYVAILGILKAGGAWCPIDTLSPIQRRHDLIARTSAGILLVSDLDSAQPDGAVPTGVKIIDVSQFTSSSIDSKTRRPTKHRATPNNTAYLIWTSGTTGAPKGVPITHSAAVSSMTSLQQDIPGNPDGTPIRCLQFSQYTFDVSIQDIFYTWGVGGVLISGTREIMLESFPKLANTTNATHAHLTPAFAAGVPRETCKTLKVITMIGEKLTQPVADDWGSDMRAFNTYGPAEVTVVSTIREFGNEHKSIKSANIGWPMKSVSVFVMKDHRVVMKNAIGELALGGPQLSPGYLNQQDVTDAKYVWNEEVEQRVYYTGDLVRMLADGSLEYVTRVDDLVKLGGIRIELSEISFALRGCHGGVEGVETMVLGRRDRPTKVVVAFLSAPGAAAVDTGVDGKGESGLLVLGDAGKDIARAASVQARKVLPENMIPSVYLVVRGIPKTPSAKVDRRALQSAYETIDIDAWERDVNPEELGSELEDESEEARSVARKVIEIVAGLVNVEPSAITKSNRLRSLGVDSLRATRLAFRLKEAGYGLSVIDVLGCITVNDLIKLARSSGETDLASTPKFDVNAFNEIWHPPVSGKISEEFTTIRATSLQESLLTETMGTYNMYWSNHFFKLDRSVDISRLRQACQNSSETLNFSILQLVYKLPALDWEYYKCSEDEWSNVFANRVESIMTSHQKDYFRQPPWAVTVLDKESERVMVFTVHHSVHDEPSLGFIMDDVRSAYTYKPPLRGQLSDALSVVLGDEKKYMQANTFWKSELKSFAELDVPVWPDLTGKRLPPGVKPEYRLISEAIPITAQATSLQAAVATLGLQSIASIIRAAWAYVSLSYLGLPATVFAETLSDRVLDPSLEGTVGPLISVVPIPFHPKGSVREVLLEQHGISVQSWKDRHIHARDVRKALNRPRGEPLYPAVFNFHAANQSSGHSLPELWQELEDQVGLHVEHPMAMNVFQNADGSITLEASSDSRIFSPEHLQLFVRQIDGLISSMLESPDETFAGLVSRLPSHLRSLSNREVSEEVASSIYQAPTFWLEKYAGSHPDWTAVEVASSISPEGIVKEAMSYGELNAEANRVAAYLASFEYRNRIIGVCAGRTLASYPIIIGIFKSGNTYLPIDESLPADRKRFLLEDGNAPIVFTETALSSGFSGVPDGCRVECIDSPNLQKTIAEFSCENHDYASDPDDTSYLLFTSGSTGKPKGVMVTRANLSSFIESISEFACRIAPDTLHLRGEGRYLAQANRAFDPHLLEMFFPWRHGMATVTAPRPMILDDIGTTLSKWDITHASFVPSLVDQANITPEQCPKLRFITVGGEKITQKVLDTWASAPGVAIVNAYGPTEVTIGCTFAHINKHTNLRNIGPPLTACTAHVLIPGTMEYALRGQTGELCFSGDLVARGYLNRPDAMGFLTLPDGVKMYRTGDIGRLMADDSVEYLGRGDDQTKIRGQRLELGEVSEVLRASSRVAIDVVTTVAKHPGLAKVQLLSFVSRTPRGRKVEDVSFLFSDFATLGRELQEVCRRKLPAYMVPELILPVTAIPVAALSGKADMKELQRLFGELPLQVVLQGNSASAVDGGLSQREMTIEEEAVVNEICHVVSADSTSFGPLTNIFEIGLDSLSAIGLSIRLRNIGYAATVALVMSNPVVEQLARLPRSANTSSEPGASEFLQRCKDLEDQYRKSVSQGAETSGVEAVWPCLPLQEGLVARSINSDDDQLYVNHVTLQLGDGVDPIKLKEAWQTMTNEHAILRTGFVSLEKEIAQVIFRKDSYAIQWTELEYSDLEDAIEEQKQGQAQISQATIANISVLPPVRLHLARSSTGNDPLALFISIHHALYDGESFAMMLEDVTARYEGNHVIERGSPSDFLKNVSLQDAEEAKKHWVQTLSGCSPTLFRSEGEITRKTTSLRHSLNAKLSDLETCSAKHQTTVPNLMQAIFALLLADYVGSTDVTYGLVLSGRTISAPGAETVLLPCITTIPGRLNTNELNSVAEIIEAVQRSTARSLDFQHTSLRKIQQWLKSETPLFDCLFSYIRTAAPPNHKLFREPDSHMPSEYPLALEVQTDDSADTVQLECIFSPAFGSQQDGEDFVQKMNGIISELVSGAALPLDSFNLAQSQTSGSRLSAQQWDESTWSATETKIRELTSKFCELSLEAVTKGASFLSLGIDSVTAIQFARKLREEGLKASSSDVMRFSCVGALARHVDGSSSETQVNGVKEDKPDIISVDVYGRHVPLLGDQDAITSMFECTPLQSGMITQTISSSGKVYVNPHPIRLSESVDIDRLKNALGKVIQANEILRTSFHLIQDLGDSWFGAVHSNPPFEWTEITVDPTANVLSEVTSLFTFNEERSFHTAPLRVVLVHQQETRILVIILHHSLYDGASLPFIFEDLATVYDGQSPPSRPQFSSMVPYIHSNQEKSTQFWTETLEEYESAELPPLSSPLPSPKMLSTTHKLPLDLKLITTACKEMSVTVQSVALLSYAKVYATLLGKRDVVFGQVLAGRNLPHADADQTLGPLFNTVAQRVTFEPNFLSNRALAQRIQKHNTEAQEHQHAPLRAIQNNLRQNGQLAISQLFDSLFVFQKSAALEGSILDSQDIWTPYEDDSYVVDAEYKLNVEVDQTKDGIVVTVNCNPVYMDADGLERFVEAFEGVFRDVVESPTRGVTSVPGGLGELPLKMSPSKGEVVNSEGDAPEHEAIIQTVLSGVTGIPIEDIKPSTSIFNLGLDSLSAIRIASICRGKGLKVGVGDILQGNTLRGISGRVQSVAATGQSSQAPLIKDYESVEQDVLNKLDLDKTSVETILPCLPGQLHHLASWLKSDRKLFEPAWAFSTHERIDSNKLEDAWFRLRQQQPVLRTVFTTTSPSEAIQVILKEPPMDSNTFRTIESTTSLTNLAKKQAHEEALYPSTLHKPPIRLRLLKASDQDGILIFINHALYDAWSMPMLVSNLASLYQGHETAPEKEKEKLTFPSFVESSLRSLGELDEKAYWTSSLSPATPTIMHSPKSKSTEPTSDVEKSPTTQEHLFIPAWSKLHNLSALESTARTAGLSLQTLILLSVARCISRRTGIKDPMMGLYQTGRSAPIDGIENLAGPCLNVTPFVVRNALAEPDAENEHEIRTEGKDTVQQLKVQAKAIQKALADRVSYEQSSLRDILRWINPTLSQPGQRKPEPLFNTWVNLLWTQDTKQKENENNDDNGSFFKPLPIGVPTDFIPPTTSPTSTSTSPSSSADDEQKTSISDLDTTYLPNTNVFIDIAPNTETDSISFGVRIEGGVLDETEGLVFIDEISAEIEGVISVLCSA